MVGGGYGTGTWDRVDVGTGVSVGLDGCGLVGLFSVCLEWRDAAAPLEARGGE